MMSSSCSGGKLPSLPLLYLPFLLFLLFFFYFFLLFLLLLLLIHLFFLQVGFAESAHACVSYSSSPFSLPSSSPAEKLNHIVSYYEILKVASVLLYTYRLGRAVFRSLGRFSRFGRSVFNILFPSEQFRLRKHVCTMGRINEDQVKFRDKIIYNIKGISLIFINFMFFYFIQICLIFLYHECLSSLLKR